MYVQMLFLSSLAAPHRSTTLLLYSSGWSERGPFLNGFHECRLAEPLLFWLARLLAGLGFRLETPELTPELDSEPQVLSESGGSAGGRGGSGVCEEMATVLGRRTGDSPSAYTTVYYTYYIWPGMAESSAVTFSSSIFLAKTIKIKNEFLSSAVFPCRTFGHYGKIGAEICENVYLFIFQLP